MLILICLLLAMFFVWHQNKATRSALAIAVAAGLTFGTFPAGVAVGDSIRWVSSNTIEVPFRNTDNFPEIGEALS